MCRWFQGTFVAFGYHYHYNLYVASLISGCDEFLATPSVISVWSAVIRPSLNEHFSPGHVPLHYIMVEIVKTNRIYMNLLSVTLSTSVIFYILWEDRLQLIATGLWTVFKYFQIKATGNWTGAKSGQPQPKNGPDRVSVRFGPRSFVGLIDWTFKHYFWQGLANTLACIKVKADNLIWRTSGNTWGDN
jgi:hypothetical protein